MECPLQQHPYDVQADTPVTVQCSPGLQRARVGLGPWRRQHAQGHQGLPAMARE